MDLQELLMTAVRSAGVYALMLVVLRVLGKRTIGNFSAFDLLVALMLGEVVDEMIYGDVTFGQGTVAIATLALLEYGNSWLSYKSRRANQVLEGQPVVIVENGRLQRQGMRQERMNDTDVMAALRLHGITDVHEVKRAFVEVDGVVSVLKEDWAESLQKCDLGGRHAAAKAKDAGGRQAPAAHRTDSPRALGEAGA
jgi:uncharacterized membrane protein YcaP (DUF421 family)